MHNKFWVIGALLAIKIDIKKGLNEHFYFILRVGNIYFAFLEKHFFICETDTCVD